MNFPPPIEISDISTIQQHIRTQLQPTNTVNLQTFGILLECQNVWIYVLQQDAHSHDSSTLYYTDFCNCFFQNVQIFMVMIPRTRSLVSLYIMYFHKRFICSSGLKYIKKSNSGKPQIICLKCFSLSKRNIETNLWSNSSQMSTFNFQHFLCYEFPTFFGNAGI